MKELLPPSPEERAKLLSFIAKRELTDEERVAVSDKAVDGLSIAHLDEIVVRSKLHKKNIPTVIKEILAHRAFMNKGFDKNERTMGLGADDDY
jgi:predicted NACHT family NTPase